MATATAPNEDALRDALETQDGIRNLGLLSGTRTIKHSMDREERVLEAEENALHQELHGGDAMPHRGNPTRGKVDEPMEIMIGKGDVIVNQAPTEKPPTEAPPVEKPPAKSLLEKAAPFLLAAAVILPPLAILGTYLLARPDSTPPPAATSPSPGYEYTGGKYELGD